MASEKTLTLNGQKLSVKSYFPGSDVKHEKKEIQERNGPSRELMSSWKDGGLSSIIGLIYYIISSIDEVFFCHN